MVEFEDAASERMAQLEQEDLERYQRDASRNSNYSYDDETPNYVDEFHSKLSVLLDLVRGCINDFHRTPSSTVNGYESSAMNIQPVSFTDDVASCNYSDLRSEATDEQPSYDESVVNVLADYAEMMDFDGIQGTDSSNTEMVTDLEEYKVSESSINSHSSVNSSPHKQLTHMDSGFKVLSIYCAQMAPKWNSILEMRPKQSDDMSVEVYYDLFYSWKKKLDAVNYIGGEGSYIDDFIYGLEIKLGMRVCGYKWKPRTLYGAFRRAEIEETMMKNDADMVLEKRPQLNSSDIQGVENVSDGYMNVVLDASGLVSDWFRSYLSVESILQGDQYLVDVLKDSACNVTDEMVKPNPSYLQLTRQCGETAGTEYVEQILSDGVGKIPIMKTECLKVACSLFNESSSQFSAEQIIGSEGLSKWEPSMVGNDVWKAYGHCSTDHLKLKMLDEIILLNFDPGGMWEDSQNKADVERRQSKFLVCLFLRFWVLVNIHSRLLKISLNLFSSKYYRDSAFRPLARNAHFKHNSSNETRYGFVWCFHTSKPSSNSCRGGHKPCLTMYEWSETSTPNDVMSLDTYVVDSLVNKIPLFNFDPGGERAYYFKFLVKEHKMTYFMEIYAHLVDMFGYEKPYPVTQVMPIIPGVISAQVSQQFLFSMKACCISALLKGGDSLREMVDRVIIIQAGLSLSYSFQLAEQVRFYIIMSDMVHSPFYVVLAMLASVVCDTSEDVISFYIIEDNDVLKKKGIGIYLALVQDHILNEASAHYYYARTWILSRSLVDGEIFSLLIASSIFRIRQSNNLKELLVTFRSVRLDCEDTTDVMRFMNKDIEASPQFGLAFLTLGSEHYIWDPGSSAALMGGIVLMRSTM